MTFSPSPIVHSGSVRIPSDAEVEAIAASLTPPILAGSDACHYCTLPAVGWTWDAQAAQDDLLTPGGGSDGYVAACLVHGGGA